MSANKVTAGRDFLGDFAPLFAELNDDVLFERVWSREEQLSPRDRSLITVSALMGSGILDESLKGHLKKARENGVTKAEIVEVITHLAFYAGWPKAWAAFYMAKEIFTDETDVSTNAIFARGEVVPPEYSPYFTGTVYVNTLVAPTDQSYCLIGNVTFEPRCRNNWHKHPGGQILLVIDGRGWYQEDGKPAQELHAGDVVEIPPNVKHWHGAAADSWFAHVAVEPDVRMGPPVWLEPVSDEEYNKL